MGKTLTSSIPVTKVGSILVNTSLMSTHNCNVKSSRTVSYIVLHYTGNKGPDTAKNNASYFKTTSNQCSAHYVVDNSNIYQCIAAKDVAWHCGTSGTYYSDCRNATSVGIEMCCTDGNYKVSSTTIENSAKLAALLCKELGVPASSVGTYVIRHYDVTHKSCPAQMAGANNAEWNSFISKVKGYLSGTSQQASASGKGTQASSLKNLSVEQYFEKVGPLFTADQNKSGVLACVSLAQFTLESGYGKTELAQNANNCFGMKETLSGNTWPNSAWDGKSTYVKKTEEQTSAGKSYYITATFRKYSCIEDSIADHSAYLSGAKNGSKLRYDGLVGETDYKKAANIIKGGGYATDTQYVSKLCNLIAKYSLTKYNSGKTSAQSTAQKADSVDTSRLYRVRKTWANSASQLGAYSVLDNAKKVADLNQGYYVFDENGNAIYPVTTAKDSLYRVRKSWSDSSSQKGAYSSIDNAIQCAKSNAGYFVFNSDGIPVYPIPFTVRYKSDTPYYTSSSGVTKAGMAKANTIYTIVEVVGSYGHLKSGVGWVRLDDATIGMCGTGCLDAAKKWMPIVYDKIVEIGCAHKTGATSYEEIVSKKITTCATSVSAVLQKAGVVKAGKKVGHTDADGKSGSTKTSVSKAISGTENLVDGTYSIVRIDKTYADMDAKYKKTGIVYVQDSNICMCAGNGYIYSTNQGGAQYKNGKYVKDKVDSGYPFTTKILYAIIPKE